MDQTSFGRYTLLQRLGVGGMAEVYLAEMTGPEGFTRRVALKRILDHLSSEEEFITAFISEARLGGTLSHQNIVQTLELGREGLHYYLSMEYVEGLTLAHLLRIRRREGRSLPLPVIIEIARQICEGLDYAHSAKDHRSNPLKMVHRDLKPDNILISLHGMVKISDFGVARAETNLRRTMVAGTVKGTIAYMSPEQAAGLELDHRSDLYSLGAILYEMLTYEPLYPGARDTRGLELVQAGNVEPQLARLSDLPPSLVLLVRQLLARDRAHRPGSAWEIRQRLLELLPLLPPAGTDVLSLMREAMAAQEKEMASSWVESLVPWRGTPKPSPVTLTSLPVRASAGGGRDSQPHPPPVAPTRIEPGSESFISFSDGSRSARPAVADAPLTHAPLQTLATVSQPNRHVPPAPDARHPEALLPPPTPMSTCSDVPRAPSASSRVDVSAPGFDNSGRRQKPPTAPPRPPMDEQDEESLTEMREAQPFPGPTPASSKGQTPPSASRSLPGPVNADPARGEGRNTPPPQVTFTEDETVSVPLYPSRTASSSSVLRTPLRPGQSTKAVPERLLEPELPTLPVDWNPPAAGPAPAHAGRRKSGPVLITGLVGGLLGLGAIGYLVVDSRPPRAREPAGITPPGATAPLNTAGVSSPAPTSEAGKGPQTAAPPSPPPPVRSSSGGPQPPKPPIETVGNQTPTPKPGPDVQHEKPRIPNPPIGPTTVATPATPAPRPPGSSTEAARADGFLTIKTTPFATLKVDGLEIDETPLYKVQLKAGRHKLTFVTSDDAQKIDGPVVTIKSGEVTQLDLKLK